MFRRETIHCLKCDGIAVRRSRWHSHDEKLRNPGREPVRCSDCGHRFLVAASSGAAGRILLAGGIAAALLTMVLTVVLTAEPSSGPEDPAVSLPVGPGQFNPVDLRAAEAGDPEAQFRAASALLADPELNFAYSGKAIGFLEAAAEHGHIRAMLRLGLLYRKGVGALQNFTLAAKWLEKAALSGDAQAMLEFGRLHREGIGVPKDPVRAYVWFNRAAAARDPDAPLERQAVARLLTPDELHRAQEQSARPAEPTGADAGNRDAKPAGVTQAGN